MSFSSKKLFVVGAGPGDPELLTIKALNIVKNANVILYDNLINKDILEFSDANCIKRYVGKDPSGNYVPQEEINNLILNYCARYDVVVRLKGGDPYLFGRGFEEWSIAKQQGIEISYVPGISSMQGAGMSDIPLTHRGVSEGVWALTGMKRDGSLSADLQLAVQSKSTVVIYMGMQKLDEIARMYVMNGKGDMPAAIIQHATCSQERKVLCKVADLLKASRQHGLGHPAIIVIGEVVNLQHVLTIDTDHRHVI
ncbi:uroporphyrinogen-III C-methyltransferase [Sphingobacterium suaedae]|uniref:uroporphyrinogen-III C-methyltransferase n=1 Tax=Sphingobacterium suaedae TaxID=1686402 RepID=A0ABW5KFT0_9SPHI